MKCAVKMMLEKMKIKITRPTLRILMKMTEKDKTYSPENVVPGCSEEQSESSMLDYAYYFSQDVLQEQQSPENEEIERSNQICTIGEDNSINEELPEEQNEDLLHERTAALQTLIEKQKPVVVGNMRTNITLPPKLTKKKKQEIEKQPTEHDQFCCHEIMSY